MDGWTAHLNADKTHKVMIHMPSIWYTILELALSGSSGTLKDSGIVAKPHYLCVDNDKNTFEGYLAAGGKCATFLKKFLTVLCELLARVHAVSSKPGLAARILRTSLSCRLLPMRREIDGLPVHGQYPFHIALLVTLLRGNYRAAS
jgi:hypothetical protein